MRRGPIMRQYYFVVDVHEIQLWIFEQKHHKQFYRAKYNMRHRPHRHRRHHHILCLR